MPATFTIDEDRCRRLAACVASPAQFTQAFLTDAQGHGHRVWSKQRQIMDAIANDPRKAVAVKACHASSKTFTAACLVLWWLVRFKQGMVVTTAPTWLQVKSVLWSEIRTLAKGSRIAFPEPMVSSLRLGEKRFAIGLSTREGVRFHGFHGQILVILDEAPGVQAAIFEAIDGIAAGGDVRKLALGNPLTTSGPFFDAFGKDQMAWHTITIDAFDTPNLVGLTEESLLRLDEADLAVNPWPMLVSRRWVRDKLIRWGVNHPMYQARVRGRFPLQSKDSVYSVTWIEMAKQEPVEDADGLTDWERRQVLVQVGLDVAGPGEDETVMYARRGHEVLAMKAYTTDDPRGEVLADLNAIRASENALGRPMGPVIVDSNGIGYYFALYLLDAGYDVRFANPGAGAVNDASLYVNLRAEMAWALREAMEQGKLCGLIDDETRAQLATIRYTHTAGGRVQLESKDDARKRGVLSPDRAESLMYAYANVPPPMDEGYVEQYEPKVISPY